VKRDAGLIQLLAPPFDRSALDPGYIKGYVPGVRENGGQYTHAAIWATMAFATLGDSERAWELLRMINPVLHGRGGPAITQYKVEPYVMTADVYGVSPHEGRGGWSWYTGSAAWMYRLVVESLLGLSVIGDRLSVAPLLPANWRSFEMTYRYGDTPFRITVNEAAIDSAKHAILDGMPQQGGEVILVDDGREHTVEMGFPRAAQGSAPIVVLEDS
jgi:cellobiose phosphorylase